MTKALLFLIFSFLTAIPAYSQTSGQVTLTGQVVCSACWFEADDRKAVPYGTPSDVDCAKDCADKGLPQALAVETDKGFTLYTMERGAYAGGGNSFVELVPKRVEVTGTVRSDKDKNFIKVDALRVIGDAIGLPKPASDTASLALKDILGADVSLDQYKGRFVVLNFWATWCEPCKTEMPDLSAIQNEFAATGVQVIGASSDSAKDAAKVLKFTKQYKVNFPVWLGATTADMERFGVGRVLPATVIIDREGKIVTRVIGMIKAETLRKELDKLITAGLTAAAASRSKGKKDDSSLVPA